MTHVIQLEVKFIDGAWNLLMNGVAVGQSKNRFDADHAVVVMHKVLRGAGVLAPVVKS